MLKIHVKEQAGPWKYPRWIDVRADLPRSATGKIYRTSCAPKICNRRNVERLRCQCGATTLQLQVAQELGRTSGRARMVPVVALHRWEPAGGRLGRHAVDGEKQMDEIISSLKTREPIKAQPSADA